MIFRTVKNKDNPYFQMNKSSVNNPELSFKAVGIHAYLMSKPNNWEANEADLIKAHADGRDSVRAGIAELIKHGYMHRVRQTDERGVIVKWCLDTYESPELNPYFNPQSGNPEVGNPEVVNPIVDYPESGFPEVENPQLENPTHNKYRREIKNETTNKASSSGSSSSSFGGNEKGKESTTMQTTTPPAAAAPPDENEGKWQAVCSAYESEIGVFTSMTSEIVREAMDEYGAIMVVDAIKAASTQNVRKWAYVDGILKRWKANGRPGPKPIPQPVKIVEAKKKANTPAYLLELLQ